MKEKEVIICSAIHYPDMLIELVHKPVNIQSGTVFYAPRHHQIIEIVASTLNRKTLGNDIQGFITNHRRFVGRKEGWKIAKAAGQVTTDKSTGNSLELYSEDLY